jgi:hypothetical protein
MSSFFAQKQDPIGPIIGSHVIIALLMRSFFAQIPGSFVSRFSLRRLNQS